MGDARAEHAPEELVDPAVAWGTLGAHVVNAKGAHGALEWGVVGVRSLHSFWDERSGRVIAQQSYQVRVC